MIILKVLVCALVLVVDTEGSFLAERVAEMAEAFLHHLQRIAKVMYEFEPVSICVTPLFETDTVRLVLPKCRRARRRRGSRPWPA